MGLELPLLVEGQQLHEQRLDLSPGTGIVGNGVGGEPLLDATRIAPSAKTIISSFVRK